MIDITIYHWYGEEDLGDENFMFEFKVNECEDDFYDELLDYYMEKGFDYWQYGTSTSQLYNRELNVRVDIESDPLNNYVNTMSRIDVFNKSLKLTKQWREENEI